MTLPEGAVLRKPSSWRLSADPQPRTPSGSLLGRPRGDQRLMAVLSRHEWTPLHVVAERLGKSLGAAQQALYRAQVRGFIEHGDWRQGWRIRRGPSPEGAVR